MTSVTSSKYFLSICIPAYKRIDYLKRLLDSIALQDYQDFEVVVADDSPDDFVRMLCAEYENKFRLQYFKNSVNLGTPENWNAAITKASGEWIKLMHDDDWFYDTSSLGKFAAVAKEKGDGLIFSAYQNIFLDENRSELVFPPAFRMKLLAKDPATLLSRNIIGPPSVIMHPNNGKFSYDKKTKWVVDIDFYIRFLGSSTFHYVPDVLINVGMSQEQVTASCSRVPDVEIPENLYLMNKLGWNILRNLWVYDSLWRLLRNFKVRSVEDLRSNGYTDNVPAFIEKMIRTQSFWGWSLLSVGVFSKLTMLLSFISSRKLIGS